MKGAWSLTRTAWTIVVLKVLDDAGVKKRPSHVRCRLCTIDAGLGSGLDSEGHGGRSRFLAPMFHGSQPIETDSGYTPTNGTRSLPSWRPSDGGRSHTP